MVFASKTFLYYYLPFVLVGYFLLMRWRKASNLFLTVVSLGFYAWGEHKFVFVMMASIVVNWLMGLWVDREKRRGRTGWAKGVVALMCVFNLGLLGVFKYLTFLMRSVRDWFGLGYVVPDILLPIGISFFTFQAMSYVIDVYRGKGQVQRNLINVCLYISFFPQLIAGPIVRYQTIANEISNRRENLTDFTEGCKRFMIGFCKKVILANQLGLMVDQVYALADPKRSVATAWLGALAYLLQVYTDFSGYSDMAIGLGRMFGFHFLENFDYPWLARSVTEFWRRWHISMCTWFRDYLYFPLGGSRVKSKWRLMFNIFMVWFCTGLWHGAAWTYVLWGLSFFAVQMFERFTGLGKWLDRHPFLGPVYMIVMVVFVTVLIRSESIGAAGRYYLSMLGIGKGGFCDPAAGALLREYWIFLLGGLVTGLPVARFLRDKVRVPEVPLQICGVVGLMAAMLVSISYLSVGAFNPFIYFNF